MKEITRRLYTKPVMLSLAFIAGAALLVGLFVTVKSRAATPVTIIYAGDDEFETTADGETYHNFTASPIPANFFGPGSQQYSGTVPLEGVPLAAGSFTDTIIHRNQDVLVPGTTSITMTGLSLKATNPITVTYTGGGTEQWEVAVSLSTVKASTGSMTINSGGTFDSSLKVWPKFTFTRNGVTKVLDTGGGSGLMADTSSQGSEASLAAVSDAVVIQPGPEPVPTATVAPCRSIAIDDFEQGQTTISAASSSCPPVTLTSSGSPWQPCGNGGICFPQPLTEAELLAAHHPRPKGTKKALVKSIDNVSIR